MKDAAQPAISLGAPVVVIGSCNPSSLARDVAQFVDKGYRLRETTLLDMFSHTSHVETLIWLER